MDNFSPGTKPAPLTISRLLPAAPDAVFRAWSKAEYVRRWFAPEGVECPSAEVDFRAGGAFVITMRMADGTEHLTNCRFVELVPPRLLVFAGDVISGGTVQFTVHTTVTFAAEGKGTRIAVTQLYEVLDAAAAPSITGAEAGWSSTLAQLGAVAASLATPAVHGSFTLERVFAAPPARVFFALTNLEAKSKWFAAGPDQTIVERSIDARPGGRECVEGRWSNGTVSRFDAFYFDTVPGRRLVYAYEMHINGVKISVSLATLELSAVAGGTKLVLTEQGSFIDGYDDNGSRAEGTGFLLDKLGAFLSEEIMPVPPADLCGKA